MANDPASNNRGCWFSPAAFFLHHRASAILVFPLRSKPSSLSVESILCSSPEDFQPVKRKWHLPALDLALRSFSVPRFRVNVTVSSVPFLSPPPRRCIEVMLSCGAGRLRVRIASGAGLFSTGPISPAVLCEPFPIQAVTSLVSCDHNLPIAIRSDRRLKTPLKKERRLPFTQELTLKVLFPPLALCIMASSLPFCLRGATRRLHQKCLPPG